MLRSRSFQELLWSATRDGLCIRPRVISTTVSGFLLNLLFRFHMLPLFPVFSLVRAAKAADVHEPVLQPRRQILTAELGFSITSDFSLYKYIAAVVRVIRIQVRTRTTMAIILKYCSRACQQQYQAIKLSLFSSLRSADY